MKPDAPVQCWGPQASDFARTVLGGAAVTITADPQRDDADTYGRALRYLTLPDGADYSTLAAGAGMARAYPYDTRPGLHTDQITDAENTARTAQLGLWGPPCHGRAD